MICFTFSVQSLGQDVGFIDKGDSLALVFDNKQALSYYMQGFRADTSSCLALWKLAEVYVNLGEDAEKFVRPQYFYTAEKWARKALAKCPAEPNTHFFVAVTSGLLALSEGGKRRLERSKEVKTEAERTLALDPQHHGAHHVLGRWHREVANLNWVLKAAAKIIYGGVPPGASNELAIANFMKAIEISPEWINHHRELGLTYLKMGELRLARKSFQRVLELPLRDHEDAKFKAQCKEMLSQLDRR